MKNKRTLYPSIWAVLISALIVGLGLVYLVYSSPGTTTIGEDISTTNLTVSGNATTTGNQVISGNLNVSGISALATTTATKLTVSGTTALNGGLTMNTDKFTVADGTGNTVIAGTLDVSGTSTLATTTATKLTVSGATALDGGLTMNTDKFKVADGTGNTVIAGTLDVSGTSTLATTTIGGGTAIAKFLFGSCQINPGNLGVRGASTSTVATDCSASGTVVGDKIFVTPKDLEYQVAFHYATTTGPDIISISVTNLTDSEFDPATSIWNWLAIR